MQTNRGPNQCSRKKPTVSQTRRLRLDRPLADAPFAVNDLNPVVLGGLNRLPWITTNAEWTLESEEAFAGAPIRLAGGLCVDPTLESLSISPRPLWSQPGNIFERLISLSLDHTGLRFESVARTGSDDSLTWTQIQPSIAWLHSLSEIFANPYDRQSPILLVK